MKQIITIQHTQSSQHINGMMGGWADWDLTDLGVEQAKRIGERLSHDIQNRPFCIYSSDLKRAAHTADIVAGFMGVKPQYTNSLRECNLGEANGKPKEWARGHASCSLWPGTIDWPVSCDDRPFPGAETRREVWQRLTTFYNRMMRHTEENFIIVSHDGTLSLFYALWLGWDVEKLSHHLLSGQTGGVSILREDADEHHIICRLNDLSYIR